MRSRHVRIGLTSTNGKSLVKIKCRSIISLKKRIRAAPKASIVSKSFLVPSQNFRSWSQRLNTQASQADPRVMPALAGSDLRANRKRHIRERVASELRPSHEEDRHKKTQRSRRDDGHRGTGSTMLDPNTERIIARCPRRSRKMSGFGFSGNPTLLWPDACFPSMTTSLRDLCVLLCRFPSCDGGTSEATAVGDVRLPSPRSARRSDPT